MSDDTNAQTASAERDYKDTVFLPQTPFPMRAGLPKLEPEILARWKDIDLYQTVRAKRQADGRPLFVLHDGPPYANGAIHIGHALNKILKDFVVRTRMLLGYDVDYVPGWDCHGLPIEWKIEEKFRSQGRAKGEVSKAEFRVACREYAGQWIGLQSDEFQRLGVLGDWSRRYATMDYGSEATIVREFHKFLMSGQLYRGSKPVMWSPVERTSLADAEVEYKDHVSPTVWVKFPVIAGEAVGASVVIWTTTPWTMPGNRAISFGPEIAYGLYEVEAMETGLAFEPWAAPGDRLIVADKLAADVAGAAKIASWKRISDVDPSGLTCAHPLRGHGYEFDVPMLAGDHVTDDAGTGFVHTAPGHGADDYAIWIATGHKEIPETVDADGKYYPDVPLFGGMAVMETDGKKSGKFGPANGAVMDKLIEVGNLLARGRLEHSYPHSWRSGAPIIFRNTPQWFIRMDEPLASGKTLRETAVKAIADTEFYPEAGRNRIGGMVAGRPDWLISRQRAWGTPLALFVDKATREPLADPEVNERIAKAIETEGADAWFVRDPAEFLGPGRNPDDYEKIDDILDVWFDSGSTHAFVLDPRLTTKPDYVLYLEGSDQHRGWFQSSLLEGCGTRGRAPFDGVLTHGFTLDEKGEKMSKSKGNSIEPQTIIKESGAEIIRLWAAMVDYSEDQRIGKQILGTTTDGYRKLRNTLRYLLGALDGFEEAEKVAVADLPPLERYILHRMYEVELAVRAAYEGYRFSDAWRAVTHFASEDLSALYFDVRKDSLYCDRADSLQRRAVRTVMDLVFDRLTLWLAPLAVFTTEEAWTTRFPEAGPNALRELPKSTPEDWKNEAEAARWAKIGGVLQAVNGALEVKRNEKLIGSALEADVAVTVDDDTRKAFEGVPAEDVFRTSAAVLGSGELSVSITRAEGGKCARCWKVLPEVTPAKTLCLRCEDTVAFIDAGQA
jgi:isoleucyl-tRNA synthetase